MKQGLKAGSFILLVLTFSLFFSSCGSSSGGGTPPPPAISVSISPTTSSIAISANQTFTATVHNSSNTAVTWSVQEGTAGGAITSAGVYTAPNQAGTYHVIATAQADSTKSASVPVTVTAPAPVFTSTPPGTNSGTEGSNLSYVVTATDPAGGTVSYTLTTGPSGAALTGNTLNWTPTSSQARTSNNFTITAATSEGGTATQSFQISPSGTVHGTRIITYHTSDSTGSFQTTNVPDDTTAFPISAYIPDGSGGFSHVSGQGSVTGTYSISNVPAGYFWLQHGFTNYLWTKSSTIDTGYDFNGRSNLVAGSSGTSLSLTMSNASPWQSSDLGYFFSPNSLNYFWFTGTAGATQVSSNISFSSQPLMDASQGDFAMVYQMVHHSVTGGGYQVLGRAYGPQAFTVSDGVVNTLNASFVSVTPTSTVRASVKGSQFAAFTSQMGPGATNVWTCSLVDALPSPAGIGYFGVAGDLVKTDDCNGAGLTLTDTDLGDVQYGDPYPSTWPFFAGFLQQAMVPYTLAGTTTAFNAYPLNLVYTTTLPTTSAPLTPLVGPVVNPRIAAYGSATSTSLQSGASGVGATPVISWQPPTVGSPTGYAISVMKLGTSGSSTVLLSQVTLRVGANVNSVQIPPALLTTGATYVIGISAQTITGIDMAVSPYRRSLPVGQADVLSGIITP